MPIIKYLEGKGMPSLEGVKLKCRKNYIAFTAGLRSKKLLSSDFTIIANNCWAGFIYQSYGIAYNTPTVGLYFMPDDYLKFVQNLDVYLTSNLTFIDPTSSRYKESLKATHSFGLYPVGKIRDIEIIFLHYHSEDEAYEKWTRRSARVNKEKLLIKFNDQNRATDEHISNFDKLDFKNKICFTSKEYQHLESVVCIKSAMEQHSVLASQEPFGRSKYININKLINNL